MKQPRRFPGSRLASLALLLPASLCASVWLTEVVDTAGAGKFTSMRVDSHGNIHLAYSIEDGSRNPLKYAFRDVSLKRWFTMKVAEGAAACSLALDSNQRPRISWTDFGTMSGSKLRYAQWTGSAWRVQPIPLNSDVIAYYNSIVLDAEDNAAISFYEYRGPKETDLHIRMRIVQWDGQVWGVKTVDPTEGSGKFNSMAIDRRGRIHLAYANVSSGTEGLRYALWDGKRWKAEVVDDAARNGGGVVGQAVSVALDKEDNPHITYMNVSSPSMKYAVRRNGRWSVETVDTVSSVGYPDRNGIAVSEDGGPFISYYDAGRGHLKVAYQDRGKWLVETVDENAVGFTSSVQIHGGELWVSYADLANGAIRVSHTSLPGSAKAAANVQ